MTEFPLSWLPLIGCALLAAPASAQSLADMIGIRNPTLPWRSIVEVEAGMIGSIASEEVPAVGLEDGFGWDGHVLYREEDFGDSRGSFTGYAGRDGIFASLRDGKIGGNEAVSIVEFRARPWQFYRDGYYRGSSFVPNGLYEGSDYEGYLGLGRELQPGLYSEVGSFYRDYSFSSSGLTPSFRIPDDYAAYGVRLYFEQNTTQLDRRLGTPREGGMATLALEQEWNDSSGQFGASGFLSELPSQVWRARAGYDYYAPADDNSVWEFSVRGAWSDRKDRVQNFEAQRPLGHQWADGALRLRMHFGDGWVVTPFVQGQWARVVGAGGGSSTSEMFFGGGIESYLHFSRSISLHAWYSYLDNESRPSISVSDDRHGQHMFYVGMIMRFGGKRR